MHASTSLRSGSSGLKFLKMTALETVFELSHYPGLEHGAVANRVLSP